MRPDVEKAVTLLRTGDVHSIEEALSLLQSTVFSFSMRVCGQREDAEDTMQEVLVKSVSYLPKFESAKALVVWLYKVAKNRCLMSRRRSKFAPDRELSLDQLMPDRKELEDLGTNGINPELLAIHSEQAARLREAIQNLPPRYRIILVLRDMEGLSDDEVAEVTGLRAGTVRVRLHRARLFVRKELLKRSKLPSQSSAGVQSSEIGESPRPARCKTLFAELSNYLDEQLDDSLCEDIERHLKDCSSCKVFLASLQATIAQCRRSPAECPNSEQAAMLRKRLIEDYRGLRSTLSTGTKTSRLAYKG